MPKKNTFGFDPMNVFGDVRKGTRNSKKSRKSKDCLECMQEDSMTEGFGLGIDTFSLADPNIDALGIGGDFGIQIGAKAGQSNGDDGGFLGVIGAEQVSVPSVTGRGSIARGKSRKGSGRKPTVRGKGREKTPLQRASGTTFGSVDDRFSSNFIGNVRGAKKRISDFRIKRKTRKQIQDEPERSQRQLEGKQPQLTHTPEEPTAIEQRTPALPDRTQTLPRETGSQAIAKLREEASSRGAT